MHFTTLHIAFRITLSNALRFMFSNMLRIALSTTLRTDLRITLSTTLRAALRIVLHISYLPSYTVSTTMIDLLVLFCFFPWSLVISEDYDVI
uniref:Uncharacterized protein n=1 Tax=Ciona savignyi TaxID=51511 RepID=H2YK87_CIOSA